MSKFARDNADGKNIDKNRSNKLSKRNKSKYHEISNGVKDSLNSDQIFENQ